MLEEILQFGRKVKAKVAIKLLYETRHVVFTRQTKTLTGKATKIQCKVRKHKVHQKHKRRFSKTLK